LFGTDLVDAKLIGEIGTPLSVALRREIASSHLKGLRREETGDIRVHGNPPYRG
jgi:hypothetical protein